MQISLDDVQKKDGKKLSVEANFGRDEVVLKSGRYPISEKSPVSLTLTNEGNRNLLLQGAMSLTVVIPCARCLTDVPVKLTLDFEKEVDMKCTEEERRAALDECAFLHGSDLDVDELICGEILVNWPYRVLCREDCKGICSVCGRNLNEGPCGCASADTDVDPRMAQIRDIFNQYKEV